MLQKRMVSIKRIQKLVKPRKIPHTEHKIPARILQTFCKVDVPDGMYQAAKSWLDQNPSYEYLFYDDEDRRILIREHFGPEIEKCYDALPIGAFRADLWRYCALYVHGGVYADLDTICKMPLEKLLWEEDEFVIAHDIKKALLFNAFICCSPQHPFVKAAIEYAQRQILAADFSQRIAENPEIPYWITGPGGLAVAINLTLGRNESSIFDVGRHNLGGFSFRILRKVHWKPLYLRRVMNGFRTVLMCKYPGYTDDLKAAGGSHWEVRT